MRQNPCAANGSPSAGPSVTTISPWRPVRPASSTDASVVHAHRALPAGGANRIRHVRSPSQNAGRRNVSPASDTKSAQTSTAL
jgi:hypothetical protein